MHHGSPTDIDADLATFHLRRALRTIDAHWEGSAPRFWQRATALAGLERFAEAETAALVIADASGVPPGERARAAAVAVSYRVRFDDAVDPLLLRLDRALALATEAGDARAGIAIHIERMHLYARKRVRVLADRELAAARALAGAEPGAPIHLAQAHLYLAFDERLAAGVQLREAKRHGAERAARRGLSHLAFLLGDFGRGYAELDGFDWGPDDLAARRRRIDLLEAEHRWTEVAAALAEILASSPRGEHALSDRLARAAAIERAGDLDGARRELAQLVDDAPDGRDERVALARRSLALLERPRAPADARCRLRGFPTIAQLRNHCGPASCELYLRFLGIAADQLAIGTEIMLGEGGTTFGRIRGYLEQLRLHVLRIEAPLPALKTLLALGIPVMLQESYSASGHATVAIGYDDAREILEVQDPMTHAIRETPYEEVDALLAMSNHGALVALLSEDRERMAALDRAGIRECRYMVHTDRAFAALDAGQLDEADALLDTAMAERRDYELAWICRFHVAEARLAASDAAADRVALHHVVEAATALWPEDDWVRAFAASVAFAAGRYDEAGTEYERACAADAGDPRNWRNLGHARLRAGDYPAAQAALARSLHLDPADCDANELGAYALFLAGEHAAAGVLNEVALALAPENSFNHLVAADLRAAHGDLEGALAGYARAIALDESRAATTLLRRTELLGKLGRHDEVAALLATCPAEVDADLARRRRAGALLAAARYDDAEAFAAELEETEGLELRARAALLRGDAATARELALALLAAAPSPIALAIMGVTDEDSGALLHLAAAAVLDPDDAQIALWLGEHLAQLDATAPAATYLERALRHLREPAAIERALRGFEAIDDPAGALRILDELAGDPAIDDARLTLLTEIAWAPATAAKLLRARVAAGATDPLARAQAGLDQFAASIEAEATGEAEVRAAIAAAPALRYPRWQLAHLLCARGRGDDAIALVPERDHEAAVRIAITALCERERFAEARALAVPFEDPRLDFIIAEAAGDFEAALALARAIGADEDEDEDDAQLDSWELTQFLLLLALGRDDEAIALGRAQAGSAMSLGMLAHRALAAGYLAGAVPLAAHAIEIDPTEAYAIHVLGRAAEHRGDAAEARALYERAGEVDGQWHAYLEELARLAIAEGDAEAATRFAERAVVTGGHTCFFALAIRAQARLLAGDLPGARADATRAYGLGDVAARNRTSLDAWATCALLAGDTPVADALFTRYLADTANAGPLDAARIANLRAAHARATG